MRCWQSNPMPDLQPKLSPVPPDTPLAAARPGEDEKVVGNGIAGDWPPAFRFPPTTVPQRVVLLIAYLMKHQEPQFRAAAAIIPRLKLLLSVAIEPQRDYAVDHGDLDITLQRTWTIRKRWQHTAGFEDQLQVHFPYDTYFQLRRIAPQVVVSHELGARSLFAALYRWTHPRSRLVLMVYVSEHTERSWSRLRLMLRRCLLRSADIVTYQGSSGKRYLRQLGVAEARLRYCPYVAHPKMVYRGPTARPAHLRRRLLYVGQFTPRKAPDRFLDTLNRWCLDHPDQSVSLSLVGRGPLQAVLQQQPRAANLQLEILGSVAPEHLPAVYANHGLFVFPTLADEWGLVVEEAMHSGLPVLASEYGQASLDLVEDGVHGWRFIPEDAASVYRAIDRAMQTEDQQLDRMGAAARQAVAERTPDYGGRWFAEAVQAAWSDRGGLSSRGEAAQPDGRGAGDPCVENSQGAR